MSWFFLDFGQVVAILLVLAVLLISAYIYFRWSIVWNDSTADLRGKTAIVTGANTGIGYYTALGLAKRHARVILACRNLDKAQIAKHRIITASGNSNVVVRKVDLTLMSSVREFVQTVTDEESRLDILINNAGVLSEGKPRQVTREGNETIMAANYFGPFLLTNLLLDLMKRSAPSRIINVSSVGNRFGTIELNNLQGERNFSYNNRYCDSKLALILFTRELARRLKGSKVTANALHPGTVSTQIHRNFNTFLRVPIQLFIKLVCRTAEEGAQTSLYLAMSHEVKDTSGKYFIDCDIQEHEANPVSRNMELAADLWSKTARVTGLEDRDVKEIATDLLNKTAKAVDAGGTAVKETITSAVKKGEETVHKKNL